MITLSYKINGACFKRRYLSTEHRAARTRAEVLRENGIAVKVRGWPVRLAVRSNVEHFA